MSLGQIVILALIQGAAELLPVSSSAHVIVAERLMGLDPSSPEMTFLLVMLHTGTMAAVLIYFWSRWKKLNRDFLMKVLISTAVTGIVGLTLKKIIEKVILEHFLGEPHAEVEMLFKSLPLIAFALFVVGIFIFIAGVKEKSVHAQELNQKASIKIGIVQGLCLPFRGFSRSGATISTALLQGIPRSLAEDFSFALAVVLTPPVIFLEVRRLIKAAGLNSFFSSEIPQLIGPGMLGMIFSFFSGLLALRLLSSWLETGRWKYFGIYCILASGFVICLNQVLGS